MYATGEFSFFPSFREAEHAIRKESTTSLRATLEQVTKVPINFPIDKPSAHLRPTGNLERERERDPLCRPLPVQLASLMSDPNIIDI